MSKHKPKSLNNSFGKIINNQDDFKDYFGIVYTRVSSVRQETDGTGHESQEKRCTEILKNKNIPHLLTFKDTFTGGGDFTRRPALMELLNYVDSHPHKKFVVIFDDLKRFARDVENHIKLKMALKTREVKLLCANHTFEDTPEGEAMEMVSAVFAELDRKTNRRQVIQKQHARLIAGYRAFPAPPGYTKAKDVTHGKIDKPNEKAKYIQEGLEGFANMRFIHKIDLAKFLQEKGVISQKQGAEKAMATVDKMLREVFYAGVIEYAPWEVFGIQGRHEAIIDMEVFEKNKMRLAQKPGTFVRQDVREGFELRSFVNCSACDGRLTGAPSTNGKVRKDGKPNKKYNYYKCWNKNCTELGVGISSEKLNKYFEILVKSIKPCEEIITLASEIMQDVWKTEMQNESKILEAQKRRKIDITEQITSLADRIIKTQSEVVIAQYEKQIEKLTREENEIEEELTTPYDFTIPNETSTKEVLKVLLNPYAVWENYNINQKQRFYNFMFEGNLSYSKINGFETPNYALPIRLFEQISASNTVDVEMGGVEPPCQSKIIESLQYIAKSFLM
jgi:site-specific DNA recombinase